MSLREKKKAKKKAEILQSALTILAEKGYHGTTMEDIASHLLMTKGALYYYFKDKQELVYESQVKLLNKSIENVQNICKTDQLPIEKLRKMIKLHIDYLIRNKSSFELMAKPHEIFSPDQLIQIFRLREAYARVYDELLREGSKAGAFSLPNNEIKIVRNLLLGAMNWVTQWHDAAGEKNISEFVESVTNYLLRLVQGCGLNDEDKEI